MQKLSNAEIDRQVIEECLEDHVGEIWERNVKRMQYEQEERLRKGKIRDFMMKLDREVA